MSKTPNLGIDLRLSGHVQLQQTVKEGFEKIDAAIGPLGLNMNLSGHVPLQQTVEDGFNAVDALFGGGGELLPTQAIIDDGQQITATNGQTISVAVADNVPSLTIKNWAFWEPFTVTLGQSLGGQAVFMTAEWSDDGVQVGSISNEPVEGFTLQAVMQSPDGKISMTLTGERPISGEVFGALVGINGLDYNIATASSYGDSSGWELEFSIPSVPLWTVDQQVPIVIIPQNGG